MVHQQTRTNWSGLPESAFVAHKIDLENYNLI